MRPPPRLLTDPGVAPELRDDLARAAKARPAYDMAAGLVGLHAAIASSASSAGQVAGASQSTSAPLAQATAATKAGALGWTSAKLGLGMAALIGVGIGLATLAAPKPALPTQPPAAMGAPRAVAAPAPAPELAARPSSVAVPSREPEAAQAPASPRERRASRHPRRDAASGPSDALHREVAQLGRIKALLGSNPSEAYRLAEAGNREFRDGMLRQEREALAVLALWSLGREQQATARARRFAARYPRSPLRERLQPVLQAKGE